MSKLNGVVNRISAKSGSVLVGVVVLSVAMAITAVGYLTMTGSTVNNEAEALDNERAFFAAESGLLVGTRWLIDTTNWDKLPSGRTDLFDTTINGMNDSVYVVKSGDTVKVYSEARGGIMPYVKRLSWIANVNDPYTPGTFVNKLGPSGKVGGTGVNNTWFDGPFHANTPIYLASVSNPGAAGSGVKFVNGPATVFNSTEEVNFHGGHWGNYGVGNNDYEFGIYHHNLSMNSDQSARLDDYFGTSFTHSQDSIYMPRVTGQDYYLPSSNTANARPTLVFGVNASTLEGEATYYYYDAVGNPATMPVPVDGTVLRVPNDVSVLGTVKGKTTVVTDLGASIYPVGDLTYDGFTPGAESDYESYNNTGNYGVGDLASNDNYIALISGADIHFEQTKRQFDAPSGSLVATGVKDQVMYVTASLIAAETGNGLWWDSRDGARHGAIEINKIDYTLRAIGSRTIDEWYSYDAGGVAANKKIRFFFDTRISEGLRAPGVPLMTTGDDNDVIALLNGEWTEENLPL